VAVVGGFAAACTVEAEPGSADETALSEPVTEAIAEPPAITAAAKSTVVVAAVIDGDTIELANGRKVRLLQIDAPEPGSGECYSRKARSVLREMLPAGTRVRLEADPKLDRKDQYGRLLRYVFAEGVNVNLALVKLGAASVWFYEGERGKYAAKLLRAAKRAKAEARGLWQACRGTVLDPLHAVSATSELPVEEPAPQPLAPEPAPAPAVAPAEPAGNCDSSYPDFCIPPPPPDLDCDQVSGGNFTVLPPDPHGFDGDADGYGCESY
jgi:micrococcal nuclease